MKNNGSDKIVCKNAGKNGDEHVKPVNFNT